MTAPAPSTLRTGCCIVGGGPAGMMLGLLLARAGVDVVVLEKHSDFLRDFRGDTLHPSTLDVIRELDLLDELLARPHQEVRELRGWVDDEQVTVADFSHLPTHCRFLAFMPQWDFLGLLAEHARASPHFRLLMRTEAVNLIWDDGVVRGVIATSPEGKLRIESNLTVAADGRYSRVRELANLPVREIGAAIDVLWMRLSRRPEDPSTPLGRFHDGRILVLIYRGDYWQCGYVIPKGQSEAIRRQGIAALQRQIAESAPFLRDRVQELESFDDVKLLTVKVDRLRRWYRRGLLCIGDAAHAMSPVGGVGINLAIQDAVAAANLLATPLRDGRVSTADLRRVQRRRSWPTRLTQAFQLAVQERLLRPALESRASGRPPRAVRLLQRFPALRRVPARVIGLGFRPEHVKT